ncbi:ABC transporter ATP-binding protein [Bizionia myxarmorum]|uniref:ATP-binding cassette domain-containing protein n=1 Tax=Bizionia myxarmorum TaxID=291186 RepID=A0A5D0R624_9FLAO|nr:ABC transporter ATP-binding protein [Bizionia myxarmorum]TYB76992.1 ATP-binding cassette domain-containing protein [Bizionia myxarmorum]
MGVILKAENISKQYRLGLVGTGTISHDLNRWWAGIRGKDDPYLKVGSVNDRSTKSDSDYVWALQDINFEVQQGEVLGIIGKNGAGKSTLLKILSRVTIPTTGDIKTKGRIASLLEVGTGFHPELTGRENIYLNGAILGMRKAEIKAKEQEIIEFSGCERYVDTPVKRYSSGMRVRLAFAVAAFLEPDILVIDEVLAVGDAEFQKKAIGKMQDISKGDGRTVLFVSHNMAAVKSLCTRAIVLEHGTSVFEGGTEEAVNYYLNNKTSKPLVFEDFDKNFGICKIEFLNSKNERIENALVGQEVRLKVSYRNPDLRNLSLSIAFYNEYDEFLFACRSDVIDKTYADKEGVAILSVEKWPVSKGVYSYNTSVHEANMVLENMKEIGQIVIEQGDFYGFGKLPASGKKGFYTNYQWL